MIIELFAATSVGAIIGFGACAVLTAGKVADGDSEADENWEMYRQQSQLRAEADDAHARAADALNTKTDRIERALACETPKAAHGVRKMARILRGEEAA